MLLISIFTSLASESFSCRPFVSSRNAKSRTMAAFGCDYGMGVASAGLWLAAFPRRSRFACTYRMFIGFLVARISLRIDTHSAGGLLGISNHSTWSAVQNRHANEYNTH